VLNNRQSLPPYFRTSTLPHLNSLLEQRPDELADLLKEVDSPSISSENLLKAALGIFVAYEED
jgi:hypothetical protein